MKRLATAVAVILLLFVSVGLAAPPLPFNAIALNIDYSSIIAKSAALDHGALPGITTMPAACLVVANHVYTDVTAAGAQEVAYDIICPISDLLTNSREGRIAIRDAVI